MVSTAPVGKDLQSTGIVNIRKSPLQYLNRTFMATRPPASRHTRAAAHPTSKLLLPNNPGLEHAAGQKNPMDSHIGRNARREGVGGNNRQRNACLLKVSQRGHDAASCCPCLTPPGSVSSGSWETGRSPSATIPMMACFSLQHPSIGVRLTLHNATWSSRTSPVQKTVTHLGNLSPRQIQGGRLLGSWLLPGASSAPSKA